MTARLARLWDLLLRGHYGSPCAVTGERVRPGRRAAHERDQHALDGGCVQ